MSSSKGERSAPDRALRPSADCIPIERFGEAWTAGEAEHLAGCARCQTELAVWQAFDASTPTADEGAAVQWIVAELARRAAQAPSSVPDRAWWWRTHPRWVAAAATIAIAAVVGYGMWDPEPGIRVRQDAPLVYRSVRVQAIAPVGDIAAAPHVLEWAPLSGAVVYDIQMMEVDRVPLWYGSASSTRIEIPSGVVARLVPGKTVWWEVTARNASGAALAESGMQRFRVATVAGTLRNP